MSGKSKADPLPKGVPDQYAGLWNNGHPLDRSAVDPATGYTVTRDVNGNLVSSTPPPVDKKSAAAKAAAQAKSAASVAAQEQLDQYNRTHPPMWVNGQQLIVESLNPDGTPATFKYAGAKTPNMPDQVVDQTTGQALTKANTAFGALDVGASYGILAGISGDEQVALTRGPVNIFTGAPDLTAASNQGTGDHSAVANDVPGAEAKMTIADGLQWMVKLSNQNPAAYTELVKQLKHAGYYGSNPGDMIGGGYSEQAGLGFVKALKDLSVVQQANGVTTPLDEFLAQKTDAQKKAAEDAYQPINRDYADPGALMATAKSAAEDAIGRNLSASELAAFQSSFHSKQVGYYNSVDASGKAQAGAKATGESAPGSSAVNPSADGEVNALLQGDQFNQQRANYGVEQYTQALGQLFGVK